MTPTPEEEAVGAAPNFAGLDSLCSASGVCDPMGEYPECGRGSCADCRDDRVLLELEQREAAVFGDRGDTE